MLYTSQVLESIRMAKIAYFCLLILLNLNLYKYLCNQYYSKSVPNHDSLTISLPKNDKMLVLELHIELSFWSYLWLL